MRQGAKFGSKPFEEQSAEYSYPENDEEPFRFGNEMRMKRKDPDKKKKRVEATNQFYNRWFDVKI